VSERDDDEVPPQKLEDELLKRFTASSYNVAASLNAVATNITQLPQVAKRLGLVPAVFRETAAQARAAAEQLTVYASENDELELLASGGHRG